MRMNTRNQEIGERIIALRRENKVSQETLAENLTMGRNTLSKLENGEIDQIKLRDLQEIADYFSCDITHLLGVHPEKRLSAHQIEKQLRLTEQSQSALRTLPESEIEALNIIMSDPAGFGIIIGCIDRILNKGNEFEMLKHPNGTITNFDPDTWEASEILRVLKGMREHRSS